MNTKKKQVRIAVIGVGTMGSAHIKTLKEIPECLITAVCDINPEQIQKIKDEGIIDESVECFNDYRHLLESDIANCAVIVTPHPSHLEISEAAFAHNMHVMCDKPITITASEADRMISAWQAAATKFSTMYSMRTTSCNKVIKEWLESNKLGKIQRVEMTCTQWLRTQCYFDNQNWRGTWNGEGSGLLLNQAPHNLDLLFWWFGPVKAVNAKVQSRFHNIETEDEVMAWLETETQVPINFYATTGEAPGKDYVEIVGDKGTLIRENNELRFLKTESSVSETICNSEEMFHVLKTEEVKVEVPDLPRGHKVIFENLIDVILNEKNSSDLISPGEEGIHAVEWANAMLMSSIENREISLPVNRNAYDDLLKKLQSGQLTLNDTTSGKNLCSI